MVFVIKYILIFNYQINKPETGEGRKMLNFGFDARNYYPIYRNFIWAVRAAGDFFMGQSKSYLLSRWYGRMAFFRRRINRRPPRPTRIMLINHWLLICARSNRMWPTVITQLSSIANFVCPYSLHYLISPSIMPFLRNFEVLQFVDFRNCMERRIQ